MPAEAPRIYDLKGLKCPHPVMRTRKLLSNLPVGTVITVETTDPLAVIDLPHFCHEEGHSLISSEAMDRGHRFVIGKGDA